RADVLGLEVALELEHVADLVRAGEAEAPEDVRLDGVVAHLLADRAAHLPRDFGDGQMLARDRDRLPDQLVAAGEDPVRRLADVLGRDAREAGGAHRERQREHTVLAAYRSGPEVD